MAVAEELAKKQRAVSVAEFFEKNRQILGFDNPSRSLLTAVKEAVDNSLDVCEEVEILPDVLVVVEPKGKNVSLIVEDNGPGIVQEQVPRVFGKLLYGSRFHAVRQSRGQQGIGISAAVLYSQLTSGKPVKITSKTEGARCASYFELTINTRLNEPEILVEREIEWDRLHGTRIEMELEASYVKGRRQSVHGYLRASAIVNPHARFRLVDPEGETVFERVVDTPPKPPKEVLPHPHGIELGTLQKMLRQTERQRLAPFLRYSFSRIGLHTAEEICKKAGLDPEADPHTMGLDDARRLLEAFSKVKISAPPTDCLSPIGEELVFKGLAKFGSFDFIATATRPPRVHSGHPFQVEVGIAYGGSLPREERVEVLRYANRVPLLYQQGACAITHAIENIRWKNYGLNQPQRSLPIGPALILVHVASTHLPFTSESKEAIADVPAILEEIELGLKEVARKLKVFLSKQATLAQRREKEEIIQKILPRFAKKLGEILEKPAPDINPVVARIMGNLLLTRNITPNRDGCEIELRLTNHQPLTRKLKIHETNHNIQNPTPKPTDGGVWNLTLKPGERKSITYHLNVSPDEAEKLPLPLIEGIEPETVTTTTRITKKQIT